MQFKGAVPQFFGECLFVLTLIIYVNNLPTEYTRQKYEDKYHTTKVY
jgi:hypothetical protein